MALVLVAVPLACSGSGGSSGPAEPVPGGPGTNGGPTDPAANMGGFASAACTKDNFCWIDPLPQGNALTSVWAAGPNDIWAVGRGGIVAHRDAAKWGALYADGSSSETFKAVRGTSANDVWIVGDGGGTKIGILHSDGKSLTRAAVKIPTTTSTPAAGLAIDAVWPISPTDVWAIGGRGLWHFDGKEWKGNEGVRTNFGGGGFTYSGLWASGPNDVWVVVTPGVSAYAPSLYRYDGAKWTLAGTLPIKGEVTTTQIRGSGPDDVWVSVGQGVADGLFHWNGVEWLPVSGLTPTDHYDGMEVRGPNDVYVLESGRLLHNDGRAWSVMAAAPKTTSFGRALTAIPGSSAIEAVGGGGFCARWDKDWTVEVTPTAAAEVLGVGTSDLYVAGHWRTGDATSHVRVQRFDGKAFTPLLDLDEPFAVPEIMLRGTAADNLWLMSVAKESSRVHVQRFDGATWATLPVLEGPYGGYGRWAMDLHVTSKENAYVAGGRSVFGLEGTRWSDVPTCKDSGSSVGINNVWGIGDTLFSTGYGGVCESKVSGERGEIVVSHDVNTHSLVWGTSLTDRWLAIDGVPHHWTTGAPVEAALPAKERATSFFGGGPDDTWVVATSTVRHWEGSVWGKSLDFGAFAQVPDVQGIFNDTTRFNRLSGARVGKSLFIASRSGIVARRDP
jgi:hypothetical protein